MAAGASLIYFEQFENLDFFVFENLKQILLFGKVPRLHTPNKMKSYPSIMSQET